VAVLRTLTSQALGDMGDSQSGVAHATIEAVLSDDPHCLF
jgi:hypothetical protein